MCWLSSPAIYESGPSKQISEIFESINERGTAARRNSARHVNPLTKQGPRARPAASTSPALLTPCSVNHHLYRHPTHHPDCIATACYHQDCISTPNEHAIFLIHPLTTPHFHCTSTLLRRGQFYPRCVACSRPVSARQLGCAMERAWVEQRA